MICILQNIIYPHEDICEETEMYIRTNSNLVFDTNSLIIKKNTQISFDTYFNSFSVSKWKKYTNISNVGILIKFNGHLHIKLIHIANINGTISKKTITEYDQESIDVENSLYCDFPSLKSNGIYAFEIRAYSDCTIYSIAYATKENRTRDLNIAIGFCTYKREEFILNNIRKLKKHILEDPGSILNEHLQIFIADNGQTLPNNINTEKIHLFWNKNYGGVGGFTRTIIEALYKSQTKFDYIILMDDDIILDYRIIERTYIFLSFLKSQYSKNMIGGSMLALEEKSKQIENGALFKLRKIYSPKRNLQLTNLKDIVENEIESSPLNYNGWFYCCIPTTIIHENNLPLPIFIHYDDLEYGVRNGLSIITINGICIWHPTFVGKDPLWMTYYNERNNRIFLASIKDKYSIFEETLRILKSFIICVSRYRYKEFYLQMKAVKDFYQGAESFKRKDPESFHKQLMSQYNYRWFNLTLNSPSFNSSSKKNTYFLGILNYFFPALKRDKIVKNGNAYYNCFMVKKIIIYDTFNNRAYSLKKSYKSLIACFILMLKTLFIVSISYKKAIKSWCDILPQLKSLKFWNSYLGLS